IETIEAFLKFKQKDFSLSDAEIQKFVDGGVNGPALLTFDLDLLIPKAGLKLGPALNVSLFVKKLNNRHGKKRLRELEDNTPEYCRQIATPFESPPNISELNSVLLQPFNVKIPLLPILYNKCEVLCTGFPIFKYFVECSWDTRYPEELSTLCYAALLEVEVGSSESSQIFNWVNLIRSTTSVLRQHFKTKYLWKADRSTKLTLKL
ncbi:22933_t:CDS:2, partial [Gigaspora rosea]